MVGRIFRNKAFSLFLAGVIVLQPFIPLVPALAASSRAASTSPSPSSSSESPALQADFTIHLKSRQFVPAPGLENALEQQLQESTGDRVHALAQLFGAPTADQRAFLESQGVRLLAFMPNHAWLASIPQRR